MRRPRPRGSGGRMRPDTEDSMAARRPIVVAIAVSLLTLARVGGQEPQGQERREGAPPRPQELALKTADTITFTTDEVTWPSVDVSPDGRTLIFDILGD